MIERWGSFVLKEKFKKLKADLKIWKQEVFGSLDTNIDNRKKEI